MLSVLMIPAFRPSARFNFVIVLGVLALATATGACQKVPLLAPTGSTITLTAGATALPAGGSTTLVAQVIESSGQVPHSGTQVILTTTLGTIQPAQATTDVNGRVTAT